MQSVSWMFWRQKSPLSPHLQSAELWASEALQLHPDTSPPSPLSSTPLTLCSLAGVTGQTDSIVPIVLHSMEMISDLLGCICKTEPTCLPTWNQKVLDRTKPEPVKGNHAALWQILSVKWSPSGESCSFQKVWKTVIKSHEKPLHSCTICPYISHLQLSFALL